jgi:hypothetical protein
LNVRQILDEIVGFRYDSPKRLLPIGETRYMSFLRLVLAFLSPHHDDEKKGSGWSSSWSIMKANVGKHHDEHVLPHIHDVIAACMYKEACWRGPWPKMQVVSQTTFFLFFHLPRQCDPISREREHIIPRYYPIVQYSTVSYTPSPSQPSCRYVLHVARHVKSMISDPAGGIQEEDDEEEG